MVTSGHLVANDASGAWPPAPLSALLQVDAGMAQREYEAGGQQGLDELLAALDGGFQGAGLAATDDAALSKVVLARRTDVKFQGRLDPLALLNALQVSCRTSKVADSGADLCTLHVVLGVSWCVTAGEWQAVTALLCRPAAQ